MLSAVFTFALVALAMANDDPPSYMQICGRRNPDLDGCVKNSIESLTDKLREGMPDLGVESLEPMILKDVKISDQEQLRITAKNLKLYGVPDLKVDTLHMDLEKQQIDAVVTFKKVKILADCDVTANVVVPITTSGPIDIGIDDVIATLKLNYKLVEHKGTDHVFFNSVTLKLAVKDFTSNFVAIEGEDSPVGVAVNEAVKSSRPEIIKVLLPSMEADLTESIIEVCNKILKHFDYDHALPDRE